MEVIDGGMILGEKINLSKSKPKLGAIDRKPQKSIELKLSPNDDESDLVSSSISSESESDVSSPGLLIERVDPVDEKISCKLPGSRKDSGLPSSRGSSLSSSLASVQQESKDDDTSSQVIINNNNNNNNNNINSENNNSPKRPQVLNQLSVPRISKNTEQIEALLRRINEENQKTKEVLESIQRNELRKELKSIQKLSNSPTRLFKKS